MNDWTDGEPRVVVSGCDDCGHRWYLRRECCPRCGGPVNERISEGGGRVTATTVGDRGAIALVDLSEGVRVLGRCDPTLRPGTAVRLTFHAEAGDPVAVPYFEAESS